MAAAAIAAAALVAPAAYALDLAGPPVPAEVPAAPQVSNPLPPLSSAVPVVTPPPSASAAVQSPPAGVAHWAPAIGSRTAPPRAAAAVPVLSTPPPPAGTPSGSQASTAASPSAGEVRQRHAEQQTRRLRRAVLSMEGCLGALPRRQQHYLRLRAGIGRAHPLGRGQAARRAGVARTRARAFERHALAALKQVCGGGATASASAYVTAAGARTSSGPGAPRTLPVSAPTQGEQQVLGVQKSHGRPQAGDGKGGAPSALPRTTGAIPQPARREALSAVWFQVALAALAALAGASLVRRRLRTEPVAAAAPQDGAPAAGTPAADPSQELVRDAFELLSAGDVGRAAALVHPEVRWPDPGNGTIDGRERFTEYWSGRLSHVTVDIEAVRFERRNGELLVEVNEVVRSRATRTMIGEYHATRRFTFRDGLIAEMKHGVV